MKNDRFELRLAPEVLATLERLAKDHEMSRTAIIRKAIGIMDRADRRGAGEYVGITRNREALDVVLMGAR